MYKIIVEYSKSAHEFVDIHGEPDDSDADALCEGEWEREDYIIVRVDADGDIVEYTDHKSSNVKNLTGKLEELNNK